MSARRKPITRSAVGEVVRAGSRPGRRTAAALVFLVAVAGPTPSMPAEIEADVLWTRYGTGLVTHLGIADLDGDGEGDVVVGGRGVAAIGPESLKDGNFRWANKWFGSPSLRGDGKHVQEMALADVTGDGIPDALAGPGSALFAVDGATGSTAWRTTAEGLLDERGAWRLAVGDWGVGGTPGVAFTSLIDDRVRAVSGTDGSPLWHSPGGMDQGFLDLAVGDLNGDGYQDTVAVGPVIAGFEVQALSGMAAATSGVAAPLWVQRFPVAAPAPPQPPFIDAGGSPVVVRIGRVSGLIPLETPQVVVADAAGTVGVLDGITGLPLAQWQVGGPVADVLLADLDGDPELELIVGTMGGGPSEPARVHAFQGDGTAVWALDAPGPVEALARVDVEQDGEWSVVAAGGRRYQVSGGELDGFAVAVDPSAGAVVAGEPSVRWVHRTHDLVSAVDAGEVFGEEVVLLGQGEKGQVVAVGSDGEERWSFRTGGRIHQLAAADLDGDGSPAVIEGADDSAVAVHDADGRLRWWARVPGRGSPMVTSVGAGDLLPGEGLEVVAGTWEFGDLQPGRLHVYTAEGQRLWSRNLPGRVEEILVESLDGTDRADLVVVTALQGHAVRYDADGQVVWERSLATSGTASASLLDLNGDGTLDVLIAVNNGSGGGRVTALDGRTGQELWGYQSAWGLPWVDASTAGGVATGDIIGRVMRLDPATGAELWRVSPGGAVWDGAWTVDVDGDGTAELLGASEEGNARMLSGADGRELWTAPVDEGAAMAVAATGGDGPLRVVVGSRGSGPIPPSALYVLDGRTGERLVRVGVESSTAALLPVDLTGDGRHEMVAGSGWQLRALRF